jgi:hypothetical protein
LVETAGKVTLGFVRADADYQVGAVEASFDESADMARSTTAVVLRESQAQAVADRWLAEGRIARDTIEFSLPASALAVSPGDVLVVRENDPAELYRVDKVEDAGARVIGAARVEKGVYENGFYAESPRPATWLTSPAPVHVEFLDLPLLTGEEIPHAPFAAFTGGGFSGGVAVYSASEDFGYSLNTTLRKRAVLGETLTDLQSAEPGLWMPGTVDVRIRSGALQSRTAGEVLNGANVGAIRFGTSDWEVFQFQKADLIETNIYRLAMLLRGQAGTDGIVPEIWPRGADFVLIDSAVSQIDLPLSARGLDRHYRVGPAAFAYDNASYVHSVEAFRAIGLRPYAPAHLDATSVEGDIALRWVRRTRIDGDSWQGNEVPLGEASERYHVQFISNGVVIRERTVATTAAVYTAAERDADGVTGALEFAVAQVSEQFGPGPYRRIKFDG